VRLAVIADTHVVVGDRAHERVEWHNTFRLADSAERLEQAVEHPHLRDSDLLVILGDLVHFGDRASLRAVVNTVRSCPQPVLLLSGNHDVDETGVRLEDVIVDAGATANVWSPLSKHEPTAIADLFQDAGIGLQVIEVTSVWPTPERPFGVDVRMVVDAPPGAPGMTLTHFPLLDFQRRCEGAGFLYSGHLAQLAAPPADLDRGWAPQIVLNGHLHLRAIETVAATLQLSFAALVEAPYDIATVGIDRQAGGVDVSYECVSVRPVGEPRVPVLDGAEAHWRALAGADSAPDAIAPSN
jgi:predicted phosphodiesterase